MKPSRTFHEVWAYWLMSREGSSAAAEAQHAIATAASTIAALHPGNPRVTLMAQTLA